MNKSTRVANCIAASKSAKTILLSLIVLACFSLKPQNVIAQGTGDYQSVATGNWATVSIWERYNGIAWVAAPTAPTSSDGVITIQSGHTITSSGSRTIDQTVINAGGTLTVTSNFITIANGAGTDLICNGNLTVSGGSLTVTGTAEVNSGGVLGWSGGGFLDGAGTLSTLAGSTTNMTGNMAFSGGIWNNSGTWNILGDYNISWQVSSFARTINNTSRGIINKSAGTGSFTFIQNGGGTFNNNGAVNVSSGTLQVNVTGTWAGNYSISPGATLSTGFPVTFTGSAITNNGTLSNSSPFTNNGIYKGSGTYSGSLFTNNSGGRVAPGNSPGCQTFSNGFTNSNFGALWIEVNGKATACTDYDQINVTGTATLSDTLRVTVGYTPTDNDSITIINATSLSGTFSNVFVPAGWTVNYNVPSTGRVTLVYATPPVLNDYRSSLNGGSWNSAGSWQRYNGSAWVAAASAPTSAANVITIRNGFNITITTSVTIDQTVVQAGATLTVQSSSPILTINNGIGSDLTVNGSLLWQGGSNVGSLTVNTGAVIDGSTPVFFYSGINMTNRGSINIPVTFTNGTNAQIINGASCFFSTLTVNNQFDITFISGASPTISSLNFVNGRIDANGTTISVPAGGVITGASSTRFISGRLQRTFTAGTSTIDFPVGRFGTYTPVSVTLNGVVTTASIDVTSSLIDNPEIGTSDLDVNKTVNGYWSFNESGSYTSADVTFNWDASQVDGGANTANFIVAQYYSDSPTWTNLPSSNQQPTSITATGITTFTDMSYSVGEIAPAVTNDYRTIGSGGWDNPFGVWQRFDGTGWVAASNPTASTAETITIRAGHSITNPSQPTIVDQVVVENGATLDVSSEALFTIAEGAGIDLDNFGQFQINGDIVVEGVLVSNTGSAIYYYGGNVKGPGTITCSAGSTLEINGTNLIHSLDEGLTINNYGTCEWVYGELVFNGVNTSINNYGQFNLNTFHDVTGSASTNASINNMAGGFITANNTTLITSDVQFNNAGTVTIVSSALLEIDNSTGTHTGTYIIQSGGELAGAADISISNTSLQNDGTINLANLIMAGPTHQAIEGLGTIQNLKIANANNVDISNTLTITGMLDLTNGKLITGAAKVYLDDAATVINASAASYVNGNVERNIQASVLYDFPIGDANGYAPIVLGPDVTSGGSVSASVTTGDHPEINITGIKGDRSVNRVWSITNESLTFIECDIDFTWNNATDVDQFADYTQFKVARKDEISGIWSLPTISNPQLNTINVQNVNFFGEFQIGESAGIPADYRTVVNGQWEDPAIWEYDNGSGFVPAPISPDANSSNINIRHQVDITNSTITLDQVIVENGGILSFINSNVNYYSEGSVGFITAESGSTFNIIGSVVSGNGGTTTIELLSGSNALISGSSTIESDVAVNNYGTTSINSGSLTLAGNSTINNYNILSIDADINLQGPVPGNINNKNFNISTNGIINLFANHSITGDSPGKIDNGSNAAINVYGEWTVAVDIVHNGFLNVLDDVPGKLTLTGSNNYYDGRMSIEAGAELITTSNLDWTGSQIINDGLITTPLLNFAGGSSQSLTGPGTITNMEMNNAGGLVINSGSQPQIGNLILNIGKIDASASSINITNSVTGASASSYVIGFLGIALQAGSTTLQFPVGDASIYAPVTTTINGVVPPLSVSINTEPFDNNYLNLSDFIASKTVNRRWAVYYTADTYSTQDFTFNWAYPGDVDPGADTANFKVGQLDLNPSIWRNFNGINPRSNSISVTGTTPVSGSMSYQVGELVPTGPLYYRSIASGSWFTPATTWETSPNGNDPWSPATAAPDGTNSEEIRIRTSHSIDNGNQSIIQADQLVIENNASLTLGEAGLFILDGAGDDFVSTGTLTIFTGSLNIDAGATAILHEGGGINTSNFSSFRGPGTLTIDEGALWDESSTTQPFNIDNDFTINNFGDIRFNTQTVINLNGVTTINNSGGIEINSGGDISTTTNGKIVNFASGTIFKTGSLQSTIDEAVVWENHGELRVEEGEFSLNSTAATHEGTFIIYPGAILSNATAGIHFNGADVYNDGTINAPVFEMDAITAQNINGNGTIQNLSIDNAAGVTLNGGNQAITNSLAFQDGKIITGGNKIIIGDAATVSGASQTNGTWVIGNLQRNHINVSSALTYDIGDAAYYTPVIINANITSNGGITVRTDAGDHPYVASSGIDESKSVNRRWAITNDGAVFTTAAVTFNWNALDVDGNGTDPTTFIVSKLDGGTWTLPQVTHNDALYIDISSLTSFSEFAVGEAGAIPLVGDYRSNTPFGYGPWETASSWQTFNGSAWVAATQYPTSADNNITIRAGYSVYISGDITIDQVTVDAGAQLVFNPGVSSGTLTVADGPGDDLTVNGELDANFLNSVMNIEGKVSIAAGGTMYWGGNMHIGGNGGTGSLDFLAGSNIPLSNNGFIHFDNGLTINNNTNINFNNNGNNTTQFYFSGNNTTFNNYGTFNNSDQPGVHFNNNGSTNASFNNKSTGIFNTSINTTTDFDNGIGFANEGRLNVTDGSFNLANTGVSMSGTMTIGAGATVSGTQIIYTADSLINNGILSGGITFSAGEQQLISGNGSVQNLNVGNAAGVFVGDIQTVTSNLDLVGGRIITAANGLLITGPGATISNASSNGFVEGNLRRYIAASGPVEFPIADNAASAFITINPTVTTAGYIEAKTTANDHADIGNSGIDANKSLNRTWTITPSPVSPLGFSFCDVTFNWDGNEVDPAANPANFIVGKYDAPIWYYPASTVSGNSLTALDITSFSDFQIGELSSTTPAAALSLDGVDDYVTVPGLDLSVGSFSIEFLAKRDATGQQVIFSQNSGTEGAVDIGFRNDDYFVFEFHGDVLFNGDYVAAGHTLITYITIMHVLMKLLLKS